MLDHSSDDYFSCSLRLGNVASRETAADNCLVGKFCGALHFRDDTAVTLQINKNQVWDVCYFRK
jgi:hypothetical protein